MEPTHTGTLRVGGGGSFDSATFALGADGSGRLRVRGPVRVETRRGTVTGGPGELAW